MSNSNNRRSNNRATTPKPGRRSSDAAKKGQRAGAQRSAMKRASEEAAEAVEAVDDAVDEAVAETTDGARDGADRAERAVRTDHSDRDANDGAAAPRSATRRDATKPRSTRAAGEAEQSDEAPRLPADDKRTPNDRSTRSRATSTPRQPGKPSAKQPAKKRRARPADPERRATSARNGDATPTNGSRRSAAARRDEQSPDAPERRTRRRPSTAEDDAAVRPDRAQRAERRSAPVRYDVFYGEADLAARDRSLEALWYEIADQWGPSDVGPIALVPVPPMTTADAARYAERFVSIGAAIDGDRVKLITALDLWPSDTSVAREIEQSRSERTAIVLESPSLNPASIPIIRRCTTVVPVVQLGLSEEDEVGQLVAGTGRAPSTTMLCIDRPKRRRGFARLRRSKAPAQA